MSEFSSIFSYNAVALMSCGVEEDDGYASYTSFDSPIKAVESDSLDDVKFFDNSEMETEFCDPNFGSLLFQNVEPENKCCSSALNYKDNFCFTDEWDFLNDASDITEKLEPWQNVEDLPSGESFPGFSLLANEWLEFADSRDSEATKLNVPLVTCRSVIPEYSLSNGLSTFQAHKMQPSVSPVSVFEVHRKHSSGSCQLRPNVSLKISGGAVCDAATVSDIFPSFATVTDIGFVGALSCPVRPQESESRSITPQNLSSKQGCSFKSITFDENRLTKQAYHRKRCNSVLLDHDYLELDAYPKRVQASLVDSRGFHTKELQTPGDVAVSVGARARTKRNQKNSKISTLVTNPSRNELKDCQYVTLPGRYQGDFVYFAEKKHRLSRRRSSRAFKH